MYLVRMRVCWDRLPAEPGKPVATGNSKGATPQNREMKNQGKRKGRRKKKGILQKKSLLYKVVPRPDNLAKCPSQKNIS